jgi:two-component system chemotaxis response regulator CheB
MILRPGAVYLAPSEAHCVLNGNRVLRVVPGPKVNFVCPAIDVTMQSVEAMAFESLTGVLLTGMGKDGAAGLAHLKALGACTIAQSKETCAVHGMPAEAVRLGCVDLKLGPDEIARAIERRVRRRRLERTSPALRGDG